MPVCTNSQHPATLRADISQIDHMGSMLWLCVHHSRLQMHSQDHAVLWCFHVGGPCVYITWAA